MERLERKKAPLFKAAPSVLGGEIARVQVGDIEPIPEGKRDHTLTRICGRFFWEGNEPSEVLRRLRDVNEKRCVPPLPGETIERIVWNILRREKNKEQTHG